MIFYPHNLQLINEIYVYSIYTDFNNQVFFSYDDKYFMKFKAKNN